MTVPNKASGAFICYFVTLHILILISLDDQSTTGTDTPSCSDAISLEGGISGLEDGMTGNGLLPKEGMNTHALKTPSSTPTNLHIASPVTEASSSNNNSVNGN